MRQVLERVLPIALVVGAALGGASGAGTSKARPPYLPPFTIHDDADVHVVGYCVGLDHEAGEGIGREPVDFGCADAVDPPWRPTYFPRGSGKVHFDPDATRTRRRLDAACCYWTQWGESKPKDKDGAEGDIWRQRE